MLVINDNNMKLLKMKEKLLEVSSNDKSSILEDYAKLANEIDSECYNQIINKINNCNYNELPWEEQIIFLSEIEDDYNYLNQLQWMMRNTYSEYTDLELDLSDINTILIDNIIQRISDIQGYLMNIKNLESNKIELDRLNYQLISYDKENEKVKKKLSEIKNELRNEIIRTEGRLYNTRGNLETISIVSELKKYGIELSTLVDDNDALNKIYNQFKNEKNMQEEMLKVTASLPNKDEEIYRQIEIETTECQYKYKLIELINEVCFCNLEYNSFKNSLYKISVIIDDIKDCLKKLEVRFYINPFDRIKIDSKIQIINSIRDYNKDISDTKKTITYITSMNEDILRRNNELELIVNTDVNIIKEDSKVNEDYFDNQYYDVVDNKTFDDIISSKEIKDNQVISLRELKEDFKIERAHEKTDGVIKRVYEMFNNVPIVSDNIRTPELLLEPVGKEEINTNEDVNLFDDMPQDVSLVFPHIENGLVNEDNITEDNSDNIFLDEEKTKAIDNSDLFHEVPPFEETPLFSDRYDNDIFKDNNESKMIIDLSNSTKNDPFEETKIIKFDDIKPKNTYEPKMPDAFWVTKEEKVDEDSEKELSIDEQVAALMQDNDQIRIKKKAA